MRGGAWFVVLAHFRWRGLGGGVERHDQQEGGDDQDLSHHCIFHGEPGVRKPSEPTFAPG